MDLVKVNAKKLPSSPSVYSIPIYLPWQILYSVYTYILAHISSCNIYTYLFVYFDIPLVLPIMVFGLKKKTATDQWKYQKEQERAKLQESHFASASSSASRSSSWSSSASHSSLQKVEYPSGPFPNGPRNCLALPLPDLLSGIAVCVPNRQQFERQESGNPVFDCVAVAAQFGLDLLHSYKGFRALVTTGTQILELSRDRNVRCRDPSQTASHAADFLSRITDAFPVIAVHNLRAMNARTNKGRWEVPQDRMFPPHHAAVIELNRGVS